MGLPLDMQEANTMICAPLSTIILARDMALFPGQPPQLVNPTISTGPVFSKANFPLEATVKSVVPRHMSSENRINNKLEFTPTFETQHSGGFREYHICL